MWVLFLLFLLKFGSSDGKPEPESLGSYKPATPLCIDGGSCVAPVSCAPWYLTTLYTPGAGCELATGAPGICCPHRIQTCKLGATIY